MSFGDGAIVHPYGDLCHAFGPWVREAGDCDDAEPAAHPGAAEVCDGIDNDCDPATDEEALPAADRGGDGDGSPSCPPLDCDDDDPNRRPGAEEVCDGKDNDCDPATDERVDADGDGSPSCPAVDCDDSDPRTHPDAREVCDGKDNDCNPTTTLAGLDVDADGDGFLACRDDCDDADATVFPDARGVCGVPTEAPDGEDPDDAAAVTPSKRSDEGCVTAAAPGTWPWRPRR